MAFQRSYSKVWWGSDNQLPAAVSATNAGSSFTSGGFYSFQHKPQQQQQHQQQQQPHFYHQLQVSQRQQLYNNNNNNNNGQGFHSLDLNNFKSFSGNLSRIQEVDDEQNISKLSWEKRNSPGSLRSQDSGFSDNDESHSTRSLGEHSSKNASPSAKSNLSVQSVATPPTVVRRVGKSEFYSPLVSVSRRISFSGTPNNAKTAANETSIDDTSKEGEIEAQNVQLNSSESVPPVVQKVNVVNKQKRRRRVVRKSTRPLTPTRRRTAVYSDGDSDSESNDDNSSETVHDEADRSKRVVPDYNNETVYLGAAPAPYNNETVTFGSTIADNTNNNNNSTFQFNEDPLSPLKMDQKYTSTPKEHKKPKRRIRSNIRSFATLPGFLTCHEYENPLLNGHSPALQTWLDDLRYSYDHEVLSTLQSKSIAQEAFKNMQITTNTVTKLIRQMQQRGMSLQADFDRMERMLSGSQNATLNEALATAQQLIENVTEFTQVLIRRSVFFTHSRADRKKYEDNIEQIKIITKDTRYSLERHHYINLQSLLDDLKVLKRYLLIGIRAVFEKMIHVIVQSIENSRCDLMLRANINMLATLSNIDYEGFASLTHAFIQSEAVRALLIVCLETKLSSIRAMTMRALATICCSPAAIAQLASCGGVEVIRDILQVTPSAHNSNNKRGDLERREAVSLLTQITAPWHGHMHRVEGLKVCVETIVEGLTQMIIATNCVQTLLLCAAALNNLTRMEITSHYSIMSHEAIFKLIDTVEKREDGGSVFLLEQIVAMLHNMSLNKKCHSHLANGSIINFITFAYQMEFYKRYNSRAESDAQQRAIKSILHTLTRLVHDSSLGVELLQQQHIPSFLKMSLGGYENTAATAGVGGSGVSDGDSYGDRSQLAAIERSINRDISQLARELLLAKKREQLQQQIVNENSTNLSEVNGEYGIEVYMEKDRAVNAVATVASTTGLKFNLTRQESHV